MPYRRLPKTDAARLKALKTLLDNNEVYTVRNRFIDWQTLNRAQPAYDRLLTACEQYRVCLQAQTRSSSRFDKLQHKASIYVSHFLQVLLMAVERGEIKRQHLTLYGLPHDATSLSNFKTTDGLIEWGKSVLEGEKARLKKGGRPIYNPTIGMVSTHWDIFKNIYEQQKILQSRTQKALDDIQKLRPEVDEILLDLWNQIEKHFENEPPEVRFEACRKFGVVYYYRRHEEHLY
nr:hypothetical protein [Hoylesella enoeca]